MNLFNSLLEELSRKIKGAELYKTDISTTISNILNIEIKPDNISIKNGTLFLNVSPTIKTSVLLKKELIIKSLDKYGVKTIG